MSILRLSTRYGGFGTPGEWKADLEKRGLYDVVDVALGAREEANRAKWLSGIGVALNVVSIILAIAALFVCR
jgi:hypothetical protein